MEFDNENQALVQKAVEASRKAYCPYSNYYVGAALKSKQGEVFLGCNVENSAFSSTICAERTALVKAVSEGHREFEKLAIVTKHGGIPCGSCRQMLYEFGSDLKVICADLEGSISRECELSDLLPNGFGPVKFESI